ncbi:MAG: recombinase XerC, partial [Planctomycetota bacterium]
TYATTLYMRSNHNLRLVQEQLGHRDLRSTQVYTAVDPTAYDKLYDQLY